LEGQVQAPIILMIRNGFSASTQKLVPEILVSGLAILLVTALFANVMRAKPPSSRVEGPLAAASSQATADFMERVALSHVGGLKPPAAAIAMASTGATAEPAIAAAPLPPALASAPGHDRPHAAMAHVAATTPEVLPPPRPPLATAAPFVVAGPAKAKPLRPLRYGMQLITQVVGFVPASGTRVYEGMASVGDALASFAKKL
jgi:hypothetical protein